MRAVVQRVRDCTVTVENVPIGEIERGLLVYLGVGHSDTRTSADYLVRKVAHLRIFADDTDSMNLSVVDLSLPVCVVSQFTLFGDTRKGRRPSYAAAAPPEVAERLYDYFVETLKASGVDVETGRFGARMNVAYTNEGPVTLWIDSEKKA